MRKMPSKTRVSNASDISKFREESSFRTWVTRITVNCALIRRKISA